MYKLFWLFNYLIKFGKVLSVGYITTIKHEQN